MNTEMNREFDLVIFDWDGTLMDSVAKIVRCFMAAMADANIRPPEESDIRNIIGLGLAEAMAVLLPNSSDQEKSKVIDLYREHFLIHDETEMPFFEGVETGLSQLQDSGYQLAVATGKNRVGLDRLLNLHDFEKYFTATRCSDETSSKPNPQMLNEILASTNVRPDRAIMVGDTTYDMEMAQNADVARIAVSYGVHECPRLLAYQPRDCLKTFPDVLKWLT